MRTETTTAISCRWVRHDAGAWPVGHESTLRQQASCAHRLAPTMLGRRGRHQGVRHRGILLRTSLTGGAAFVVRRTVWMETLKPLPQRGEG